MKRYVLTTMILVILVAIGLNGCTATLKETLMRDEYPSYSDTVKNAINNGQILEGMTENQAYLAMSNSKIYGYRCVTYNYYKGRFVKTWSYQKKVFALVNQTESDCAASTYFIYFINGKVVGWTSY
jgi:hypothetical protein